MQANHVLECPTNSKHSHVHVNEAKLSWKDVFDLQHCQISGGDVQERPRFLNGRRMLACAAILQDCNARAQPCSRIRIHAQHATHSTPELLDPAWRWVAQMDVSHKCRGKGAQDHAGHLAARRKGHRSSPAHQDLPKDRHGTHRMCESHQQDFGYPA
eukprot:5987204-Prymnesium_polylepis.1